MPYLAGSIISLYAMIDGGADAGWTFYTPYSTSTPSAVTPVAFGVFVLGLSSIMTGLNFIVSVHTLRAPGITWHRMPLFVWAIYATSIIQVLATHGDLSRRLARTWTGRLEQSLEEPQL